MPRKVKWALLRAYKVLLGVCSNKHRKDYMFVNCHFDRLKRQHPGFSQGTRRPR